MARKKKEEVLYYTYGYKPTIIEHLDDLSIIVAGAEMLYKNSKMTFDYGIGELYDGKKLIFRCKKEPNEVMVRGVRNYILSQLTVSQYESLATAEGEIIKLNNYNGFFQRMDLTI